MQIRGENMNFKTFLENKGIDEIVDMLLNKEDLKAKIAEAPLSQIGSFYSSLITTALKIDESYPDTSKINNMSPIADLINNPKKKDTDE